MVVDTFAEYLPAPHAQNQWRATTRVNATFCMFLVVLKNVEHVEGARRLKLGQRNPNRLILAR